MSRGISIAGEISVTPLPSKKGWRHFFDPKQWRLDYPFSVRVAGQDFIVPAGWVFDFASIPRVLKPLFPDGSIFSYAATLHDWLYKSGVVSKWLADALFYAVLVEVDKVPRVTAFLMWTGVAIGGFPAWRAHRRRDRISAALGQ